MAQRGRAFTVRFWGVRAAIAAPGPDTVKYGGNTPCVEIRIGDEVYIVDCGTGMRDLGNQLVGELDPVRATILITRYEWDRIQGFPFFVPAFIQGNRLTVLGTRVNGNGVRDHLSEQMNYPCFPVKLADLGATIDYQDLDTEEGFEGTNTLVTSIKDEDETVVGYRFDAGRKKLAYLFAPPVGEDDHEAEEIEKSLAKQVRGAVIIYALPQVPANGHDPSVDLWKQAVSLSERAKAKQLVLFHFRPEHDDADVAKLERRFRRKNKTVIAAYEGMALDL